MFRKQLTKEEIQLKFRKPTREETQIKEKMIVEILNNVLYDKIKLTNEEEYATFDGIQENTGLSAELKSVNHYPKRFLGEYIGNHKINSGLPFVVYYYFNPTGEIYYIFSRDIKKEWMTSDKPRMAYIPFKCLRKLNNCCIDF